MTYQSRCPVDYLPRQQIAFGANQQLADVLFGVANDFLQPLFHVVERLLIGAIVNHDDAVRVAIVLESYRKEALLTGGVYLLSGGSREESLIAIDAIDLNTHYHQIHWFPMQIGGFIFL